MLLLSYGCLVTVLWLFPKVPWVGLKSVVVVYHDHTHFPFGLIVSEMKVIMKVTCIMSFIIRKNVGRINIPIGSPKRSEYLSLR